MISRPLFSFPLSHSFIFSGWLLVLQHTLRIFARALQVPRRTAGLDQPLTRRVARDGNVRGGIVFFSDSRAALGHPDLDERRVIAARQVADEVTVRMA